MSRLLAAERGRRGIRSRRRALRCYRQAVLVLRSFVDGTRLAQLAADNRSAARLPAGICTRASTLSPGLRGALLATGAAGHPRVTVDGTLMVTDRCRTPGPTPGVDPWWSGKHAAHGGNVQVIAAPDGWPIWTSGLRPGVSTTPPRCAPTPRCCRC